MPKKTDITAILEFLPCATPAAWVREANKPEHLEILLTDHLNNEFKAANSALSIIRKYACATFFVDYSIRAELLNKMSRLAREELRHFEQVLALMQARNIEVKPLSAGRYAGILRQGIRTWEPARLVDTLIAGAFIEARSCERFAVLAPYLDDSLNAFYESLLKSESRHFADYLHLAEKIAGEDISGRIAVFSGLELEAICSVDNQFRFHSGIPG